MKKRRYERDEIRRKVRNMFLNMGIDVPDLQGMKVIVHDDNGVVVEEYYLGAMKDVEQGKDIKKPSTGDGVG